MDNLIALGGFSGVAAIFGFVGILIKTGEWKAQVDILKDTIKLTDNKTASLALMQNQQNVLLAEIKVKLHLLLEDTLK